MMGGRHNADALESRMVNPYEYAGLDAGFSLAQNVPKDEIASHLSTPKYEGFRFTSTGCREPHQKVPRTYLFTGGRIAP